MSSRLRRRGKVNPVGLVLLAAAAAGGYWAFLYVPLYLDNLEVREAAAQAVNVTINDGAQLGTDTLRNRLAQVGWHFEIDPETGVEQRKPGLGLAPEQMEVTVDTATKQVVVRVDYTRTVVLTPGKSRRTKRFVVNTTGKLP